MSSSWQDNYQPNAAISYELRPRVAALLMASNNPRLQKIGQRIEQPGPSLVSTADIDEIFKLIEALNKLSGGEVFDHPWGYVSRQTEGQRFRWSAPGATGHSGGWGSRFISDTVTLARMMYEDHLSTRGLIPHKTRT